MRVATPPVGSGAGCSRCLQNPAVFPIGTSGANSNVFLSLVSCESCRTFAAMKLVLHSIISREFFPTIAHRHRSCRSARFSPEKLSRATSIAILSNPIFRVKKPKLSRHSTALLHGFPDCPAIHYQNPCLVRRADRQSLTNRIDSCSPNHAIIRYQWHSRIIAKAGCIPATMKRMPVGVSNPEVARCRCLESIFYEPASKRRDRFRRKTQARQEAPPLVIDALRVAGHLRSLFRRAKH